MEFVMYIIGGILIVFGLFCGLTYQSPYESVNFMVWLSFIFSGIIAGIFFFWMGTVIQYLRSINAAVNPISPDESQENNTDSEKTMLC